MKCFGKTHVGMRRQKNEDSFETVQSDSYVLAVVCDGMGGANGGNVASDIAKSTFINSFQSKNIKYESTGKSVIRALKTSAAEANKAVISKANDDVTLEGMGTTLVACVAFDNGEAYVINVGDSRLYKFGDGDLIQITSDHSYVQLLVDTHAITKEEALNHPNRNIILKALGIDKDIEGEIFEISGFDMLLLCSDGLTNFVSDDEIRDVLSCGGNTESKAKQLVDIANKHGGGDNITVVIIDSAI